MFVKDSYMNMLLHPYALVVSITVGQGLLTSDYMSTRMDNECTWSSTHSM